jgi:hypothetical protein
MVLFQRMKSSSTQAILDAMEKRLERLRSDQRDLSREQVAVELLELGYSGQLELDFEAKITAAKAKQFVFAEKNFIPAPSFPKKPIHHFQVAS